MMMMKTIFFLVAAIPATVIGSAVPGTCGDAGGVCGFDKCSPNCETICDSLWIPFHGHNSQCKTSGNSGHGGNNWISGAESDCKVDNPLDTCCQCRDLGPLEEDPSESFDFEEPMDGTCTEAGGVCGYDKCNEDGSCEAICMALGVDYLDLPDNSNSQCGVSGNSARESNNYIFGAEDDCYAKTAGDTCCQCVAVDPACFDEKVNLGFESGDLTGWTVSDPSETQVVCGDGEAAEGLCYAEVRTGGSGPAGPPNTVERTDLVVGCGHDSRLSFFYRFITGETLDFGLFNDFLNVKVTDQGTGDIVFTDTIAALGLLLDGSGDSGWLLEVIDMGELPAGMEVKVEISLGVQNVGDDAFDSFGLIDGVSIY